MIHQASVRFALTIAGINDPSRVVVFAKARHHSQRR